MRIAATATAYPPHYFLQQEVVDALKSYWSGALESMAVLERLHSRTGVQGRYFVRPLADYAALDTWGKANDVWIEAAERLGEQAIASALDSAGVPRESLDAIFFVSVTGVASPSVDARLVNRMGLPARIQRNPIFGLGCVAGAAGLARAADYVRAYPDRIALLVAVELCSLTWQRDDLTIANLVSSGLFGDGAAAALVAGDRVECPRSSPADLPEPRRLEPGRLEPEISEPRILESEIPEPGIWGPRILGSYRTFYPGTEEVMGWRISEKGFSIVLSPEVPNVVRENLGRDVDAFLAQHGLERHQIGSWIMHTGGPKVLQATAEALGLNNGELDISWDVLRRVGNLSSASVLVVLDEVMRRRRPAPGTRSILAAMGPGFCSEMLLLEW